MLAPLDKEIALQFKEKLLESGVPVETIRVYGSRARGDATIGSDLDICVILQKHSVAVETIISRIAWETGFKNNRIITTVEYTPDEWFHSPLRESPFIKAINQEGISL